MKLFPLSLLFSLAFLLVACGGETMEEKIERKAQETMNEMTGGMAGAMEELQKSVSEDGEAVEPIDFRELKKALPEEMSGIPRISHKGSKNGTMGMKISQAEANYQSEDGKRRIDVTIVDAGGVGMAIAGLAAWSMVEIDEESDTGYQRTFKIGDDKAMEEYNNKTERGTISVMHAKRFICTVSTRGLSPEEMREVLDDIDLDEIN